ncbi:MAG: AmmeMemoRadiSam system protein A [Fervidobacterium sp.]|uniref:AmmeMemoRadiSam system protein A n=1 Tax=Fervidobacterium sp. TaxID=1871331 RepID=UPI00404A40C2
MKGEHPFVRWAIEVIENYVLHRKKIEPHSDLPEELFKRKAGAFVTLHNLDGSLRGCIGTFSPTRENLAYEIRDNAIAAATQDPRFPPVQPNELGNIVVNVDVLSPYEPVKSIEELDPKKYGIIVQKGWRRGLLLPDIEGVDTVEEQIRIAKLKAGIYDDDFEIFRFTVERYK